MSGILAQHQGTFEAHPECEPGPAARAQSGAGEDVGMNPSALGDLHPLPVVPHVDLPAAVGVGVRRCDGAVPGPGQDGFDEQRNHVLQGGACL